MKCFLWKRKEYMDSISLTSLHCPYTPIALLQAVSVEQELFKYLLYLAFQG